MPFVQGLIGPPDVEKLKAERDVIGLIKALSYRKDSSEWEDNAVPEGGGGARQNR